MMHERNTKYCIFLKRTFVCGGIFALRFGHYFFWIFISNFNFFCILKTQILTWIYKLQRVDYFLFQISDLSNDIVKTLKVIICNNKICWPFQEWNPIPFLIFSKSNKLLISLILFCTDNKYVKCTIQKSNISV